MSINKTSGAAPDPKEQAQASRKTPLWLGFFLPIISILIFFLLLEGGLTLFGVTPTVKTDDPFVGFASHSPLFLPVGDTNSEVQMVTAPNKKDFFNVISPVMNFIRIKLNEFRDLILKNLKIVS